MYLRTPFSKAILDDSESIDELLRNWDSTLPATLGYSHLNVTDIEAITRSINEFYFGNDTTPTNPIDIQALMNVSKNIHTNENMNFNYLVGVYRQVPCIY